MSLSSLFRFKRSNEGLEVKNISVTCPSLPNKAFIY